MYKNMEPLIIVANIIALVLIYIWWKKSRQNSGKSGKKDQPLIDKTSLKLENVEVGGVIHLGFVGEDMDEYDLIIIKKNRFESGDSTWYELVGESSTKQITLEYETENTLKVSVQMEELILRDLGMTSRDLERIDDEEEGDITYNDRTYLYEDSDVAVFYPDGDEKKAKKLYYWDFKSEDGNHSINIERFEDGTTKVYRYTNVEPRNVEVFGLKGNEDLMS